MAKIAPIPQDEAVLGLQYQQLHQALIDRAEEAGASLLWGTVVKGLTQTGVMLETDPVECKWVVGADGEKSHVREWAGLEGTRHASIRLGFRRHYQVEPWRPAFRAALRLSLDRSAWLRRRVLGALSDDPGIFAAQLAMHVGGARSADFIRLSMLPLGRRLLVA